MAASHPIDVQFSREDLRRRGARDRLRNPPVVDDAFDNLLSRLELRERESRGDKAKRRLAAYRICTRRRSAQNERSGASTPKR